MNFTTLLPLLDALRERDFTPADDGASFVRSDVTVTDDDGDVVVYVCDEYHVCMWTAQFSGLAPLSVVLAAVDIGGFPDESRSQ